MKIRGLQKECRDQNEKKGARQGGQRSFLENKQLEGLVKSYVRHQRKAHGVRVSFSTSFFNVLPSLQECTAAGNSRESLMVF